VGQIVDTTESIYTVADLSNLWVWCDVYEKDLAILHEQTEKDNPLAALVKVKAFESVEFNGEVDFVGNLMDEHTRTVKIRIQVKNPDNKLRPGMFADVQIAVPLDGQMLAVPQTAVMADEGENFVFQHWKEDLWVRQDVAVGERYGDFVELLSGVPQGAKIVTGGAFMLKSDVLREKMGAGCAD
jgi:cobalt-zinc-cadmium efflux system membrane fusion protein